MVLLPELSKEQARVIDVLKHQNVIVDSVAGSGKTTTSLQIAVNNPHLKVLLLTYNSRLKTETREKIKHINRSKKKINMEAHSYHSFNTTYYNNENYTDMGIVKTTYKDLLIKKPLIYNIIILDESQDITPTYYKFVCKIYKDTCLKTNAKICMLGDKNQSIFDFNQADNRFLTNADKLFNFNNFDWVSVRLSTSYRITNNMSSFVNNNMLCSNRLKAHKTSALPVRYIILDVYKHHAIIYKQIMACIKMGYKYSDIFILAPSVKSPSTPIRQLANYLSLVKDINIFVSNNDNEIIDESILKNKIVITTFHQVKGLERKVVIVTSFDNSYFKYYGGDKNDSYCPNEFYVACTRASEILIVINDIRHTSLSFMNTNNIVDTCNIYRANIKTDSCFEYTKINNQYTMLYNINLNCKHYLDDKLNKLIGNNDNIQYLKYMYLPKLDLLKSFNRQQIYQDSKAHVNYLLQSGANLDDILILTQKEGSLVRLKKFNLFLHKHNLKSLYKKKISNNKKIVLCYNFNHFCSIPMLNTHVIRHNHSISTFKLSSEYLLNFNDCCHIIDALINCIIPSADKFSGNNTDIKYFSVTDLCKYLPTTVSSKIIDLLEYKRLCDPKLTLQIRSKCQQEYLYENVSNITGIAIPALFEYLNNSRMTMINDIKKHISSRLLSFYNTVNKLSCDDRTLRIVKLINDSRVHIEINNHHLLTKIISEIIHVLRTQDKTESRIWKIIKNCLQLLQIFDPINHSKIKKYIHNGNTHHYKKYMNSLLRLTNLYCCLKNGYFHLMKQIVYYNWIPRSVLQNALDRLNCNLSNNCIFEYSMCIDNTLNTLDHESNILKDIGIQGTIDCFDLNTHTVWEFKCCQSLDTAYFIQLAIYAYLFHRYHITTNKLSCNDVVHEEDLIYYFDGKYMRLTNVNAVSHSGNLYNITKKNSKPLLIHHDQVKFNNTRNTVVNHQNIDTLDLDNSFPTFKLFNIFTYEIHLLQFDYHTLKNIIDILIDHKVNSNKKMNTTDFIASVNKSKQLFFPSNDNFTHSS